MLKLKKVLCFHAIDSGRDIQALAPVLYNLIHLQDCLIIHAYLLESYKLNSEKPDLVLLANAVGSKEHVTLIKACCLKNIPVFSLTAEGNMIDEYYRNSICWGWNSDKEIYHYKYCFWSKRTFSVFNEFYNNKYLTKSALTGASGFDVYKMIQSRKYQENPLQGLTNDYDAVIGYAGWAFGKVYSLPDIQHLSKIYKGSALDNYIEWGKTMGKKVCEVLRYAIESNPNYLFILKKHPMEHYSGLHPEPLNEMIQLEDYPNVRYIRGNTYKLFDLLQICDIWTCFESSTVIEAWLSQKPTINIIPDNDRRMSTFVANGSKVITSKESFNLEIQSFIKKEGKSNKSFSLNQIQKEIIENSIGFSDGLNHIRLVKLILDLLKIKNVKNPLFSTTRTDIKNYLFLNSMKKLLKVPIINRIGKIKKHNFFVNDYSQKKLEAELEIYFEICESFYSDYDSRLGLLDLL